MATLFGAPDQPSTGETSPFKEFLFQPDEANARVTA
jgi:hypothetical protein